MINRAKKEGVPAQAPAAQPVAPHLMFPPPQVPQYMQQHQPGQHSMYGMAMPQQQQPQQQQLAPGALTVMQQMLAAQQQSNNSSSSSNSG